MLRSGHTRLKQLCYGYSFVCVSSCIPVIVRKCCYHRVNGPHLNNLGGLGGEPESATVSRTPGDKDDSIVLYADSREAARQDLLKLGFHEPMATTTKQKLVGSNNDLFYTYLRHINTAFRSSAKNYNKLKSYLDQNDSTISEDQRLSYIFKYLLTESQLEVNRLRTLSIDEIARRKLEKSRELATATTSTTGELTSQQLEDLVVNDLLYNDNNDTNLSQQPLDKPTQLSLINTISLIQLLRKTLRETPTTWNQPHVTGLTIPDIVETFELFKLVPIRSLSNEGLYYSGLLLYNLGTVRLDPVNESFYINSLVAFGEYKMAYKLFVSYRNTVREKWWDSLGLMVLLAGNNMKGFWRLLREEEGVEKEMGSRDLSPKVIKLGLKKFIQINDLQKAKFLTQQFLKLVDKYGVENENDNDTVLTNKNNRFVEFQNEDEANSYLNAIEKPTRNDFITIINYYTKVKDLEMLGELIAKFLEVVPSSSKEYDEVLLKTNLCLLQDFESLKQLISRGTSVLSNNLQTLKETFQTILQRYGDCEDINTKNLLFSNINSLISNPNVAQTVKQILGSAAVSLSSSSPPPPSLQSSTDTEITRSELYKNLLQLLLFSNSPSSVKNERKALEILKCMEECNEETSTVYVRPNAYHYAVFIDYYALRLKTGKGNNKINKRKRDKVLQRVESILHRMQKLKIEPNDKFLSKLLFFYNKLNDFNSCFEIINSVLDSVNSDNRANITSNKQMVISHDDLDNVSPQGIPRTPPITELHGRTSISMGLYYSIWMTYNRLYSLTSVELSELTEKSNYKLWRPVVKQQLGNLTVHPRYELAWILNNMINVDNVMPNYAFYRLILGTLMKARDWELVSAVLVLMSDKHGCQIDLSFVRFVLEGIRREFVVHHTHEILEETKSKNNSGIDYATARIMAIEAFRSNKGFLSTFDVNSQFFGSGSRDNPYNLLIQQVLRLLKYKNPYDTQFTGVLEQCKYLDVDPGRIISMIDR